MSTNIKKYTKDQMAKMVEDAQAEAEEAIAYEKQWRVQVGDLKLQINTLKAKNSALTEQIDQMNGEAINRANEIANLKADADALRNKLADTEEALGRANAELGAAEGALGEMDDLRTKLAATEEKKERMNATLADCRATLAQEVEKRKDWEQRSCWQFNHPWRNLWAWVKRKLVRHD